MTLPEPTQRTEWVHGPQIRSSSYLAGARVDFGATSAILLRISAGWAYEVRTLPADRRQVFCLLLPGDDVFMPARPHADDSLVALTRLEVRAGEASTLVDDGAPELREAIADILSVEIARLREQAVRLGLLDAQARIAHLLLDLHRRLAVLGMVQRDSFRTPLTQDLLASVLGLSVVHINRSLQRLRSQGLITIQSGRVTLHDLPVLAKMAGRDTIDASPSP